MERGTGNGDGSRAFIMSMAKSREQHVREIYRAASTIAGKDSFCASSRLFVKIPSQRRATI